MKSRSTIRRRWQSAAVTVLAVLLGASCGVDDAHLGSRGKLSLNASKISFGGVPVGNKASAAIEVTNTSAAGGPSVKLSKIVVGGTGFSVTTSHLPVVLAPGHGLRITIDFAPRSAGTASGSLSIAVEGAANPAAVPLNGTGIATATVTTTPAGVLTVSPASLGFGNVVVGSSQALPVTITNSGGSSVSVTSVTAGSSFSVTGLSLPLTLAAGKSASFDVVFAPTATGKSGANLAIANTGATPGLTMPLSGTGMTPGTLAVTSMSFGNVQVGKTSTQTATVTNNGGTTVSISQMNLSGSGFTLGVLSLPLQLGPGQSFTFSVSFTPQATGNVSATITVVSNAPGNAPDILLSGTGTAAAQLAVSPASLSFGSVTMGASKSLTATLSATGASVTVTSAAASNSQFALTGLSLPVTIPAGGSVSCTVTFAPRSSGAVSATLSFTTDASNSPAKEAVSGSGSEPTQAAVQHRASLSWTESDSNVTSYNVYRGGTSGGPYVKLASTNDTNYADMSVQAGQTYYYVTTSVASDGTESSYSNEASAVIPSP